MSDFQTALSQALSKFSSMGSGNLELNLAEQILVSMEIDISKQYPTMMADERYESTLQTIQALDGYPQNVV